MSAYATSSPSASATRLYRMREPSVRRTWWKLTSRSSVAVYSFTPMLTSPKEMLPFQIERIRVTPSKFDPQVQQEGFLTQEWTDGVHARYCGADIAAGCRLDL